MHRAYNRSSELSWLLLAAASVLVALCFIAGDAIPRTANWGQWLGRAQEQQREVEQQVEAARASTRQAAGDLERLQQKRAELTGRIQELQARYGLGEVQGPGVRVTLSDAPANWVQSGQSSWYIVHDEDVKRVVNELLAAGAECVAINGIRILGTTQIRCGGPVIMIGETPLTPPFVIEVLGDGNALAATLQQPAGADSVYQELTAFGIGFHIETVKNIALPAVEPNLQPVRYARTDP